MPMNLKDYPSDWREISARIRDRSGGRCEECGASNHEPHPETGSMVVLTVSHTNHDTTDNRDENLRALCQRCHNRHDAPYRARNRKYGRGKGQLPLLALLFLLSCAPVPPATMPLGSEHAVDELWESPKPVNIIMLNLEPGTYHGYAGDDPLPFLWGYLPAPPERMPLDPVLRVLNDERNALAATMLKPAVLIRGSDYHALSMHAMTGGAVTTPVTITIRRTR